MMHPMKNIFNAHDIAEIKARLQHLNHNSQPQWGKMNVGQMLAHLNVAYEMVYDNKHPRPNALVRLLLKLFVKNAVTGPKPYPRSGRTAPAFVMTGEKDFDSEKKRLIDYLDKTQQLGEAHFDGKESHSFGKLTKAEWNTLFYKHLDHHFTQFGV